VAAPGGIANGGLAPKHNKSVAQPKPREAVNAVFFFTASGVMFVRPARGSDPGAKTGAGLGRAPNLQHQGAHREEIEQRLCSAGPAGGPLTRPNPLVAGVREEKGFCLRPYGTVGGLDNFSHLLRPHPSPEKRPEPTPAMVVVMPEPFLPHGCGFIESICDGDAPS